MQLSPAGENDPNWVEITFPEETVVRTVEFPSVNSLTHAWCYEPGVELTVQAILPSGSAEDILHTYLPQGSWQDDRPVSLACHGNGRSPEIPDRYQERTRHDPAIPPAVFGGP